MARLFIFLKFRVEIIGKENIPTHGNYIVASNHCTVYDPILIGCIIKRRVHFLAKIELFRNRFFEWFFAKLYAIPVNRRGMVIRPVRRVLKILDEGEVFGIFPEGKRCKDGENIQPKKGVAFFALKTNTPIVPISITYGEKRSRTPVKIIVGLQINATDQNRKYYSKLSSEVMEQIRALDNDDTLLNKYKVN